MISIERPRHIRGTTGFMRSRLPQLLVVCRGGAVFSQPGYERGTARIAAGRLIQGCALRVFAEPIQVGAAREQLLRRGTDCVPELRGKGRLIGEVPGSKYTRRDA
jgi:hypothetical protein